VDIEEITNSHRKKTPFLTASFQCFCRTISVETRIVGAATWMASLLWERVYLAVA
jgi:hypothetical protein